ncbi:hypothetical protein ACFLZZ_02210 [Nanoarchaeota archaeon]
MVKKSINSINMKSILILLVLAVFLVSGQQECAGGGSGGIGEKQQVSTSASTKGIDFSFEKGIEYLSSGKELRSGDIFYANLVIENSDERSKNGEICIRDDIDDIYGGISSECVPFQVKAAVYEGDKLLETGRTNVLFGSYIYEDFPIDQSVTAYFTLKYIDQSRMETVVPVPEPETERLSVVKKPSPLDLTVEKRVSLKSSGYGVDLTMQVRKESGIKITTQDSSREGVVLIPQLSGADVICDYTDPSTKFLEFKERSSTSIIKCQALLPKEENINYPLLIDLSYGVELEKKLTFKLEKEEKSLV